jgi:tetratricopeptide (TPR) repeat protein
MACLEDALFELDATLGVMAKADASAARNARDMFEALPSPTRCAESDDAQRTAEENSSAAVALREQLATARALTRAARYDEAIELLRGVTTRAESLQSPRLVTAANFAMAEANDLGGKPDEAMKFYEETIDAAATAHDDRAEAASWIQLVRVAATRADIDAGERYRRQAEASLQRLGSDAKLEVRFAANLGVLEMRKGEYAQGAEHMSRALAMAERELSPTDPLIAALVNNLGASYGARGEHAKALEYFERAEQLERTANGPMHPDVATCLQNVGVTYDELGQHQRASEVFLEVLRIRESALGPEHAEVGAAYHNLGTAQSHLDNPTKALELFEKALAIRSATIGPDHPSTALTENNMADTLIRANRPNEALPHLARALDSLVRKLGPDHPYVAFALYSQGEAHMALGEPQEAIAPFERALALREAKQMDPLELARTRFALATALMAAGTDRERALQLARTAAADYRTLGKRSDPWLADAERWLAKHDHPE